MNIQRVAGSALIILLIACNQSIEPPPAIRDSSPWRLGTEAAVQTDRAHYRLEEGPYGPETAIATTFRAPADRTVYLMNCNGAFCLGLERLVDGKWVHAWAAEINGCFPPPIVIAAGSQISGTMTVASGADAAVDEVWLNEKGRHSDSYATYPDEYRRRVVGFLQRNMSDDAVDARDPSSHMMTNEV